MTDPIEFKIEFVGLPKAVSEKYPSSTVSVETTVSETSARMSPVIDVADDSQISVTAWFQTYANQLTDIPKKRECQKQYIRIDGHKVEVKLYEIGFDEMQITLVEHPFVSAYLKRRNYCALRHRSLKMKGKLKNLKR